jgi:hypothetical protein
MSSRVTRRSIEAAINTLGALTTEEHDALTEATRDEIGHVIAALDQILDERR